MTASDDLSWLRACVWHSSWPQAVDRLLRAAKPRCVLSEMRRRAEQKKQEALKKEKEKQRVAKKERRAGR